MHELGISLPAARADGSLALETGHRGRNREPGQLAATNERDRGRAWRAWAIVIVAGSVLLAAILFGFGMLLTHLLVRNGGSSVDARITNWLVARRTDTWNTITRWATLLANTEPVVAIAALVTAVLLLARRWREALFLSSSLLIEITVFLSVNFLVARPRPPVPRLNSTPSTGSYPSGHSAATVVLWAGIAIIVTVLTSNLVLRLLAWLPAVILPPLVAFARVYRGLHYTTDVLTGLAFGMVALTIGALATRAWVAGHFVPLASHHPIGGGGDAGARAYDAPLAQSS